MSSSDGVCPFPMSSKDVVLLGVVVGVVAYVGTSMVLAEIIPMIASTSFDVSSICFI